MTKIVFSGPLRHRVRSIATLLGIGMGTTFRHVFGRRMAEDWGIGMETGIRFVRHQFTRAMQSRDMSEGRAIFDSLQLSTDDIYRVTSRPASGVRHRRHLGRARPTTARHGGALSSRRRLLL
jgi:hypothetical protein